MQAPSAPTLSTMRTTLPTRRHATTPIRTGNDTLTNTSRTSTLHETRYPRSLAPAARLRDIYGIDTPSTTQHSNAEILTAATSLTTLRHPSMARDFEAKSVLENLHLAPKMTFSNKWEKIFPSYEEEMEAMDSGDEGDSVVSPSSPEEEESEDEEEDMRSDFGDKGGRERYMAIWELKERWWRQERELDTDDDEGYETIPDSEPDSDEEVEKPKIDPVKLQERERAYFAKQRRRLQSGYAAILMGMRGDEEPEPEPQREQATQPPLASEGHVADAPGPGAMAPLPSDRQRASAATWGEEPAPTTNGRKRASEQEEEEAPPKKRAKTKRVPTKRAATAEPSEPANNGNRRRRSKPVPTPRNRVNGTQPVNPSPLRQSTSTSDKEAEDARLMPPPPARPNRRSANGERHARPSTNGNGRGNRTPASAAPSANGAVGEGEPSEPVRTRSGRVSKKTAKASDSGNGSG